MGNHYCGCLLQFENIKVTKNKMLLNLTSSSLAVKVPGLGMKVESVGTLCGFVSMASRAWRAAWMAGERTLGNPERGLRAEERVRIQYLLLM